MMIDKAERMPGHRLWIESITSDTSVEDILSYLEQNRELFCLSDYEELLTICPELASVECFMSRMNKVEQQVRYLEDAFGDLATCKLWLEEVMGVLSGINSDVSSSGPLS